MNLARNVALSADNSERSISKGEPRGAEPDMIRHVKKFAPQLQIELLIMTEAIVLEYA